MSKCKNFKAHIIGVHDSGNHAIMTYARCKQWSCAYCADANRKQWQAALLNALNGDLSNETWVFVTITAHRRKRRLKPSLRNIQIGFAKAIKRFARAKAKQGGRLSYVRIYEQHKDGSIHVHMICNYVPDDLKPLKMCKIRGKLRKQGKGSRSMCDHVTACGMGYIFQAELIQDNNAGLVTSYITKYMTKSVASMPKGIRRIQTSRDIKRVNLPTTDYEYRVMKKFTLMDFYFYTQFIKVLITDMSDMHTISTDDFDTNHEYIN